MCAPNQHLKLEHLEAIDRNIGTSKMYESESLFKVLKKEIVTVS